MSKEQTLGLHRFPVLVQPAKTLKLPVQAMNITTRGERYQWMQPVQLDNLLLENPQMFHALRRKLKRHGSNKSKEYNWVVDRPIIKRRTSSSCSMKFPLEDREKDQQHTLSQRRIEIRNLLV
ncbi:hypothetical protein PROFUN_04390 [Planoprotostelium fungivorum]|uniref:Uncharacterized protein n=1 Tax=Planoprotostelium fungivorum TaxID=1890364 RepID=A0A2P6NHS1_9EUKA|nr:hypothetical protein PROFUN_04390 [Planoprotostelium fungivorum]